MTVSVRSVQTLLDTANDVLQKTICSVLPSDTVTSTVHPDFRDISIEASTHRWNRKTLISKLDLAISGILTAERYYQNLYPTEKHLPTQQDYLQIPVLIAETHPHGISAFEILDSWGNWFPSNTPESIAAEVVRDGCPILKIGRYQTIPDSHLMTLERTLSWSLLYAGYPKQAVEKAFQDACLTAGPATAKAAAFVAAAIAYSFLRSPKDAITVSLYGMPFPFIDTVMQYNLKPMQPRRSPTEHCALLFSVLQNTDSLQECFKLLEQNHAEAFCYLVAGAMFGANSSDPLQKEDVTLSGVLKYSSLVSKQDLAERYANLNPGMTEIKYPWEIGPTE